MDEATEYRVLGFTVKTSGDVPRDTIILAPENYAELLAGGGRQRDQIAVISSAMKAVKPKSIEIVGGPRWTEPNTTKSA